MVLLTVAVGCNGFIYSGEQSAMLDIANNFAGTLMGIINALGNTMGFVAPMIVGKIIQGHNDVEHWQVRYTKIDLDILIILLMFKTFFADCLLDIIYSIHFWNCHVHYIWICKRTKVEQREWL